MQTLNSRFDHMHPEAPAVLIGPRDTVALSAVILNGVQDYSDVTGAHLVGPASVINHQSVVQ